MTKPLIDACAGELDTVEYERCEAIAYRLVLAQIVGTDLGDCTEFGDPVGLWHATRDLIRDAPEADAVLETLADMAARAMVDKAGAQSAAQDMKKKIAEIHPTWVP
jgi:hypothetical protein